MNSNSNNSGPNGDNADVKLPADFEQQAKRRFGKQNHPEIEFQQYLEFEKAEYFRRSSVKSDPSIL